MKKRVGIIIALMAMLFIFAGCGDEKDGGDMEKKADSVIGSWVGADITMSDAGEKIISDKAQYKEFMGSTVNKDYKLGLYSDGAGDITFMGETIPVKWNQEGEKYNITSEMGSDSSGEGTPETMSAVLKDGNVVLTMKSSYTSTDDEGVEKQIENEFIITFEPAEKTISRISENMNINLTDEETTVMSTFMNGGNYVNADGTLYGNFNGNKFASAKIESTDSGIKLSDKKLIKKDCVPYYLVSRDGYIYAALNCNGEYDDQRIVKFKEGSTKMETLYKGQCSYMQLVGDKLYFTDENWNYCKMTLDGKNKSTVIEKACYFSYLLNKQWIVYQDDAADESLHLYNMKTKEDIAITTSKAYHPVIHGEYVYFMDSRNENLEDDQYNFARFNLYSGGTEICEDVFNQNFYITGDKAYFEDGECPSVKLPDEWNALFEKVFGGYVAKMSYLDGDIEVITYTGGDTICYKAGGRYEESSGHAKLNIN